MPRTTAVLPLSSLLAIAILVLAFSARPAAYAAPTITLTYMGWESGGQRTATLQAIKAFEVAHPNVKVTPNFISDATYLTRLNTMLAGGTLPDVFWLNEFLVDQWGLKGALLPLDQPLKGVTQNILPQLLFKAAGKTWGVSPGPEVMLIYYNPTLFKQAHVAPPPSDALHPWTWAQYVAAASKLTTDAAGKHPGERGFNPSTIRVYGSNAPVSWLALLPLVRSAGASFFNANATRFTLTSPTAVQTIQQIADLIVKDHAAPNPVLSQAFPSDPTMVATGKMAMEIDGQWQTAFYGDNNFQVGMAALPMFKHPANSIWGAGMVVAKTSPHKAAAVALLRDYLQQAAAFARTGTWLPPYRSWYTDPSKIALWTHNARHPEGFAGAVLTAATKVAVVPENVYVKNFGTIMDNYVTPGLQRVWEGKQSASAAIKALAPKVQPLMAGTWTK
jgi:multiple sugar transport system substrate-binding protein